jgi:hypothetical protein
MVANEECIARHVQLLPYGPQFHFPTNSIGLSQIGHWVFSKGKLGNGTLVHQCKVSENKEINSCVLLRMTESDQTKQRLIEFLLT